MVGYGAKRLTRSVLINGRFAPELAALFEPGAAP